MRFIAGCRLIVGGKPILETMLEDGEIIEVQVEGWKVAVFRARQRRGGCSTI